MWWAPCQVASSGMVASYMQQSGYVFKWCHGLGDHSRYRSIYTCASKCCTVSTPVHNPVYIHCSWSSVTVYSWSLEVTAHVELPVAATSLWALGVVFPEVLMKLLCVNVCTSLVWTFNFGHGCEIIVYISPGIYVYDLLQLVRIIICVPCQLRWWICLQPLF